MTLAPPTAPGLLGLERLKLPWGIRLTPDPFEQVCQANPDAVLELASPSHQGPRGAAVLRQKMHCYRRNGCPQFPGLSIRFTEVWQS